MRQDTSTAPLSHKRSAHRRHTTSRHSRAHGKPFIRDRRMPRWKYTHRKKQQEQRQCSSNTYPQHSLYDGSPRSRG